MNHGIVPEGCSADVLPVEAEARSGTPWTPGPWWVGDDGFVYASDGDEVPWLVAEAASDCGDGPAPDFDTPHNAHLIAAAPALYDAAAWALEVASTGSWTHEGMKRLRAALSLARGEQA